MQIGGSNDPFLFFCKWVGWLNPPTYRDGWILWTVFFVFLLKIRKKQLWWRRSWELLHLRLGTFGRQGSSRMGRPRTDGGSHGDRWERPVFSLGQGVGPLPYKWLIKWLLNGGGVVLLITIDNYLLSGMILQVEGSSVVLVTAKKHSKKKPLRVGYFVFSWMPYRHRERTSEDDNCNPPPRTSRKKAQLSTAGSMTGSKLWF